MFIYSVQIESRASTLHRPRLAARRSLVSLLSASASRRVLAARLAAGTLLAALASGALSDAAAGAGLDWVAPNNGVAANWAVTANWNTTEREDFKRFLNNGANPRVYIDSQVTETRVNFFGGQYQIEIRPGGLLDVRQMTAPLVSNSDRQTQITNNGTLLVREVLAGSRFFSDQIKISNYGSLQFLGGSLQGAVTIDNFGSMVTDTSLGETRLNNQTTGTIKLTKNSTASRATITNQGQIEFADLASAVFSSITNTGSGIIALKDRSSLGEAIVNNAGLLAFSEYGSMAAAKITNTGNMTFANFSGAGNASIDNASTGVMRFSDNSSAASATLNNAGKVFFAGFSSGGNATITNTASGNIDISGLTAGGMALGALAGGGTVSLGNHSLMIGYNNSSTLFSGVLQDGGDSGGVGGSLVKEGTGTLNLTGVQTFTGVTNINAGNLKVNGSLTTSSVINVNKGGTLSGNGKVANVNDNGGTISPGNSIGTLHILGNLTMGPQSTYHVELSGTASDLIEVGGAANIKSSIFEIAHDTDTTSAPVVPGKTYTILTTQGGLTVSSPTVAIADFPFIAFTLSADAFNGYLTTARSAIHFADLASTANEKAVAGALDTATASNPVWQQVVGASAAQARAAFTSLGNASIHANAAGVLSEQSQYLRDAVVGRLRQDFGYGTPLAQGADVLSYADESPRNAYASLPFYKAPPAAAASRPAQVYSVWAQALGSQGTLNGDGNAARTDHSLGGVISGIDVTFDGRWRVGLAGGYSQSSFSSTSIAASGSSESYHVALYGGGQVGAWGLRGGASFSWNDISTARQVTAVNIVDTERGDDALKTTQVFGEVGYTYGFNAAALEPFLNLAYVRVDGGINERGLAAMTGSANLDTTYTTLGLRGATALTQALTARGMLGWRHALGDVTPVAALAFQSGAPFALAGAPIARDAFVAEAGLDLAVAANAALSISWTGQFADQSRSNAVKGSFSWRF